MCICCVCAINDQICISTEIRFCNINSQSYQALIRGKEIKSRLQCLDIIMTLFDFKKVESTTGRSWSGSLHYCTIEDLEWWRRWQRGCGTAVIGGVLVNLTLPSISCLVLSPERLAVPFIGIVYLEVAAFGDSLKSKHLPVFSRNRLACSIHGQPHDLGTTCVHKSRRC